MEILTSLIVLKLEDFRFQINPENRTDAKMQAQMAYNTICGIFSQEHPNAFKAYKIIIQAMEPSQAINPELISCMGIKPNQEWNSALDAIREVKTARHYDKLLIDRQGERAAESALRSYASGADLSDGFAIEETRGSFLGVFNSHGILFTESTVYSEQLPQGGIPYKEIESINLQELTVYLRLSDGTEYQSEIGNSGPNVAAVRQAAWYYTNYMPKG